MPLFQRGVIKGVKKQEKIDRTTGEVRTSHKVGFEEFKTGGYQGETVIRDVQITKDQLQAGLAAHYEKIKGQEVMAEVFASPWSNGKGITLFFSGDGIPVGVGK